MPNNELLKICQSTNIQMTNQQIDQVQKDTIAQSSDTNIFKHRAGRIGASQSKAVAHSDSIAITITDTKDFLPCTAQSKY